MKKRTSPARLQRVSDRLRALEGSDSQREFALDVLSNDPPVELLGRLVKAAEPIEPLLRPILLAIYAELDRWNPDFDKDGPVRGAVVGSLAPVARPEDYELFEDAVAKSEWVDKSLTGPSILRAAGLIGLELVAPERAVYAATRMLLEEVERAHGQTGEPHVTAVAILERAHQEMVLYSAAIGSQFGRMAGGRALRALNHSPEDIINDLFLRCSGTMSLPFNAGLADLALSAPPRETTERWVRAVFGSTDYDLVEYTALGIAALRNPRWLDVLYEAVELDESDTRMLVFIRALEAVPGDPRTAEALCVAIDRRQTFEHQREPFTDGRGAVDEFDEE